jgi:hypothetical protein
MLNSTKGLFQARSGAIFWRFMTQSSRFGSLSSGVVATLLITFGTSQAADVRSFTAAKGRVYTQSSAAAPVPQQSPFVFRATVEGDLSAISGATVRPPSAFASEIEIPPNDAGTRLELSMPFPDLTSMGFIFGSGDYRFTFDTDSSGFDLAQLTLSGTVFPTAIPQIANFTVSANADFTLNWNGIGDATGWGLIINGPDGEVFAETGTGTNLTIPGGTLDTDTLYTARLRFFKELDSETQAVPGAIGTAELFNETEFTIETGAGGGGGGDTSPPILFSTTPVNNAVNTPINSTVTFNFSEAMAQTHAITWSPNVNANGFSYQWSNGGRSLVATYNGNLPANATITWQLNATPSNPANFRDLAGNQLPSGVFQGSFTTGTSVSDPNDPCNPNGGGDDGRGFGTLTKALNFVQTGNNAPVVDAEMAAVFTGMYRGASNQNVTAVTVSGPAGNKAMSNLFVFYFLSETYSSGAALETAVPVGNYTINATGAGSATVALGNPTQLPVPRINNLVELGSMNVSNNFTLNFAPFTGAGANDSIFISISEDDGNGEFHAPDICKNIQLPVTATSVVIPANTFQVGKKYSGSISFNRNGTFNENAIAGTTVSSSTSVTTKFGFTASGGGNQQPTAPRWTSSRRNANGTLSFTVTADIGARLVIESTTNFSSWTPVVTNTVVTGSYELTVDPAQAQRAIYRARVQ